MKKPEKFSVTLGKDTYIVGEASYNIQAHNYMDLICAQPQNYAYIASLYVRYKTVTQRTKDELDKYEHTLRLQILSGNYTRKDTQGVVIYTTDTKDPVYDKKMTSVDAINSAIKSDDVYCELLSTLRKLERTRDLLQEARNTYIAQKDLLQTFSSNIRDEKGYTNTYAITKEAVARNKRE